VRDDDLIFDGSDPVVVVLQDGRQLDGMLGRFDHALVIDGVAFHPWEVDDLLRDRDGVLEPR
jgi:hypothetical protein